MTSVRFPLMPQDPNVLNEDAVLPRKSETKIVIDIEGNNKDAYDTGTNNKIDVPYFRKCLVDERKKLTDLCDKWCNCQLELGDIENAEAISGEIRSVIGQARLVMAERFTQFEGLVDNCEFGGSEKPVTCIDLQGFWDMIYFQVTDVVDKFSALEKRKENQWKMISQPPKVITSKKVVKKNKGRSSTEKAAAAARREAAKKRLAAAKAALKKDSQPAISFDAGFFKVNSPARAIVNPDKTRTPSSRNRKKTVTPNSSNFLHGRFLPFMSSRKDSSTKKTLKFATPDEKKENHASPVGKLLPKNLEDFSACEQVRTVQLAENKENVVPNTDRNKASRNSLQSAIVVSTKTVGTLTDPDDFSKFGSAIDTIFEQMRVISAVQDEIKGDKIAEFMKKHETLKEENIELKRENARLKETSISSSTADVEASSSDSKKVNDGSYESHYLRLLEENLLLKCELSAFAGVRKEIQKSEKNWKDTLDLFFEKTEQLEKFKQRLNERNRRLKEREEQENEELLRVSVINSQLVEEIQNFKKQLSDYETILQELQLSKATIGQLKQENATVTGKCELIKAEKEKLLQKFAQHCDEFEILQTNFQAVTEDRKFEKEEFATNKAYFEEENQKLQTQLTTTETTLHSTNELLHKLKNKAIESQAEVAELRKTLDKTRDDMVVLREETDITKVNSKLAILEQQQEVINCEEKLKLLLETMADFLLKLKKTNSHEVSCDDMPLLSDHPLKTPSKSLVVSALLRHDSKGSTSELSPEEKFDTKAEACLFALINDVTSLMTNIVKAAAEVASRYELERKQLSADKSTLQLKVESLKQDIADQSQKDKDVELSLRRRLHEVMEERNRLRQNSS